MEFRDQKRYLLDAMVQHGWSSLAEIPSDLVQGIPTELTAKWVSRFYKSPKINSLPRSLRLVNRFMVGADPEFTFADSVTNEFVHASHFQLHVGPAFGADLAGRPVELRPAPSRFALDVVASILSELRWMALTVPATLSYSWISRPYVSRDGIGGHVHFGRKRGRIRKDEDAPRYELTGQVKEEIEGLDQLTRILEASILLKEDFVKRSRDTVYGKFGDIRPQRHGYEYRTLPTWLSSPCMAYLVLVLSKLVVYNPELIKRIAFNTNTIRNLLAYYKGMDDDALIAFNALKLFGLPKQTPSDFKSAWGLSYPMNAKALNVFIPEVIHPTDEDRETIFNHLTSGKTILPVIPKPNWTPVTLPEKYRSMNSYVTTIQTKGVGELVVGLVTHQDSPIDIRPTGRNPLTIRVPIGTTIPKEFNGTPIQIQRSEGIQLYVPEEIRFDNNRVQSFRNWICKYLPVWKAEDVKPESLEEFKSSEKVNLRGQIVRVEQF